MNSKGVPGQGKTNFYINKNSDASPHNMRQGNHPPTSPIDEQKRNKIYSHTFWHLAKHKS